MPRRFVVLRLTGGAVARLPCGAVLPARLIAAVAAGSKLSLGATAIDFSTLTAEQRASATAKLHAAVAAAKAVSMILSPFGVNVVPCDPPLDAAATAAARAAVAVVSTRAESKPLLIPCGHSVHDLRMHPVLRAQIDNLEPQKAAAVRAGLDAVQRAHGGRDTVRALVSVSATGHVSVEAC